jgi:glutamyl-tRNA reductase
MTTLTCLSVPGCRVPVSVLEALSFPRAELPEALEDLRTRTGATQLCVLSTCERTEVYACWEGSAEPSTLVHAVAANRHLPSAVVEEAATLLTGAQAARHRQAGQGGHRMALLARRARTVATVVRWDPMGAACR